MAVTLQGAVLNHANARNAAPEMLRRRSAPQLANTALSRCLDTRVVATWVQHIDIAVNTRLDVDMEGQVELNVGPRRRRGIKIDARRKRRGGCEKNGQNNSNAEHD
ncbi:MAG TPA: hypothetical protein VF467_09955 [Afipia sp.]